MTIRPLLQNEHQPPNVDRRRTARRAWIRAILGAALATVMAAGTLVAAPALEAVALTGPGIAIPQVPQDDVVLFTHDVANYGADPTGYNDNTAAFQAAIDAANAAGGGIVYAKAGLYKFTGHIVIKRRVTLRGEWQSPDIDPHYKGTLLMPYADKDNINGAPFIGISSNAGVKNLSVWYPEQLPNELHAYPYTIQDYEEDGQFGTHAVSVKNVTMYNSYQGIHTGSPQPQVARADKATVSQEPRLRDVYGTFLYRGILTSRVGNFGAVANFYSSSKYWIQSALAEAPTTDAKKAAVQQFMRKNAIALTTDGGLNDGVSYYNINIADANVGIFGAAYWEYFANINIKDVVYGITIGGSSSITSQNAQQIVDAHISVLPKDPGQDNWAINLQTQGVVDIIGATIDGYATYGIVGGPQSRPSISQSEFNGWTGAAVNASGSTVQLNDSRFNASGLHVYLGASISSAAILGNSWTGTRNIYNASASTPAIDDSAMMLPRIPDLGTTYATIPERKPANEAKFVNIESKGAQKSLPDNTSQIQAALNEAGNAGGGTVFIPAGAWRIAGSLTVPSGVQLRGVNESVGIGDNLGTTLLPTGGAGNPNGQPAVTLNANSGFVGINFYYPDVTSRNTTTPYPWTIRGAGSDVYIRDVALGNAWRGIDLFTNRNDRFAVTGVWGDPREVGVRVGGGSVGGKVENTMFTFTGNQADQQKYAFAGQEYPYGPFAQPDIYTVRFPIILGNSDDTRGLQNLAYAQSIDGVDPVLGAGGSQVTLVSDGGSAKRATFIQTQSDIGNGFEAASGDGQATFVTLSTTHSGSLTKNAFSGTINVFGYNVGDTNHEESPFLPDYRLLWNQGGVVNLIGGSATNVADQGKFRLDGGITYIAGFSISNVGPFTGLVVGSGVTAVRVVGSGARGPISSSGYSGPKLVIANNVVYP